MRRERESAREKHFLVLYQSELWETARIWVMAHSEETIIIVSRQNAAANDPTKPP